MNLDNSFWNNKWLKQLTTTGYRYDINRRKLLLLASFSLSLALLHVLPVLFDMYRLGLLVWKHKIDTFKFHHDFSIVAEIRMNVAVDVLLLLKYGIVSGDEEQESETNQPDWPL